MSPRPSRALPAELCADWPKAPCADPVAEKARQLVLKLRNAIGPRSIREIAALAGVDRATIGAVLQGKSWPDIVTLAKLEQGLGPLWPRPWPSSAYNPLLTRTGSPQISDVTDSL